MSLARLLLYPDDQDGPSLVDANAQPITATHIFDKIEGRLDDASTHPLNHLSASPGSSVYRRNRRGFLGLI
jgi:hypothetical protein